MMANTRCIRSDAPNNILAWHSHNILTVKACETSRPACVRSRTNFLTWEFSTECQETRWQMPTNANKMRNWRIYADFAQRLIHTARNLCADQDHDWTWTTPSTHRIPQPLTCVCRCFPGTVSQHQSSGQTPHPA